MKIEIIPENPYADGLAEGRKLGASRLKKELAANLKGRFLCGTLGAMSRAALERFVMERLQTPPDGVRFPELADIHPERMERLRGLAKGASAPLKIAAAWDYTNFRVEIARWHASLNDLGDAGAARAIGGHCSGVMMIGPDGVLGAQSAESLPPRKPRSYRWKNPGPHGKWMALPVQSPAEFVVRKPRTGYMNWGTTNEKGLGACCSVSSSVWLDEPIEDTWPLNNVPLLRFAANVGQLIALYRRYTLHNWNRAGQIYADVDGGGVVIEKSFRRIGAREIGNAKTIWCTEGHFESPEMFAYMRAKRLEYLQRTGKHLGAGDMQYAVDCAVRFARIGDLCHEKYGLGLKHINRILTDHSTFPRAVCRHGGPDTAPYDKTVTMMSIFKNLTRNRAYIRNWAPWKKFPCQVPWSVTQYPPIPG